MELENKNPKIYIISGKARSGKDSDTYNSSYESLTGALNVIKCGFDESNDLYAHDINCDTNKSIFKIKFNNNIYQVVLCRTF